MCRGKTWSFCIYVFIKILSIRFDILQHSRGDCIWYHQSKSDWWYQLLSFCLLVGAAGTVWWSEVFQRQKWVYVTLKDKRTRWHLTNTTAVGVFVSSFKGLWDDEDRRRGEVTLCDFLPLPISWGLTSTCTHSLSICINQTIHEPRHTRVMTHTLLSVQGRRWTKVTLLQSGRRTVNESACSASHTALSALSIRLPVYQPTFRISLWVYLVYLTWSSAGLHFTLSPALFPFHFLTVQVSVCFK